MKLRNKKTGEIVDLIEIVKLDDISNEFYLRLSDSAGRTFKIGFNSLAELNAEWEDITEEPKEYWYIDINGEIMPDNVEDDIVKVMREIGNYFATREEAEQAVEKLKAWKRLKDAGFKFKDFGRLNDCAFFIRATSNESWSELYDDLDLLFGGEE